MTFLSGAYLILLIPLGFALWRWPLPPGWRRGLRIALFVLVILALCRPALLLPRRGGTLMVVVDRSASMPAESLARSEEILKGVNAARRSGDQLGVISFGARAAVEQPPGDAVPGELVAEVNGDRSNLADALETALTLVPKDGSGRILILSDGRWTDQDPSLAAARAAVSAVPLDYRLLERSAFGDVAVESLDVPDEVAPGEGFLVSAWLVSPISQDAVVELRQGGRVIAAGQRRLAAGRTRVSFRDRAPQSGVRGYSITVKPTSTYDSTGNDSTGNDSTLDPVPENNRAGFLVGVRGPRPIGVISRDTLLVDALRAGGMDVTLLAPHEFQGGLEELAGFSAVVLDNIPASDLGEGALVNLAFWIREGGGGLMMTGGQTSFGPGGYFRSPLEEVLPVSMELRQEHRKMALAMAVALDRSGSMAADVGGGRTKMDLANLATVETLNLLTPIDELSVIAVDSSPHIVIPLAPVSNLGGAQQTILQIDSMGGGIFVYEALHAAVEQLLKSNAGTRHVILFADAADAENPAQYKELLEKASQAAITVSVVGLGTPQDVDAELLRDVAARGGGRAFFTQSPEALPRLFAQDTFVVSRSAFVDEPTALRTTVALTSLTGRRFGQPPPLAGYNLTYLQPGAQLLAVTEDDYEAPAAAAWQAGLGRTVVFTGDVAGGGEIASWDEYGSFLTSLARYAAGTAAGLPQEMMVTQELDRGRLRVRLHLDPERETEPFAVLPRLQVLRGEPGETPERHEVAVVWTDPDTLTAEIELRGEEVAVARLDVEGVGTAELLPVRLPYGPELAPTAQGAGQLALERLARASGGRQRLDVADVWREFPRRPRRIELTPWLLGLALLVFLAEILERRTALISSRGGLRLRMPQFSLPKGLFERSQRPARTAPRDVLAEELGLQEVSPDEIAQQQEQGGQQGGDVLAAMNAARKRATRRTDR